MLESIEINSLFKKSDQGLNYSNDAKWPIKIKKGYFRKYNWSVINKKVTHMLKVSWQRLGWIDWINSCFLVFKIIEHT